MLLRRTLFINRLGFDVCRRPIIQLLTVEPDAAPADGKFVHVWANLCVEHGAAHAQIRRRLLGPDEAREKCELCIHWPVLLPVAL
jgi:phage portal protein BeeE